MTQTHRRPDEGEFALPQIRPSADVVCLDEAETTTPDLFKSIGAIAEEIVCRIARRHQLSQPVARMVVEVAELARGCS